MPDEVDARLKSEDADLIADSTIMATPNGFQFLVLSSLIPSSSSSKDNGVGMSGIGRSLVAVFSCASKILPVKENHLPPASATDFCEFWCSFEASGREFRIRF
ncbi:hypothetical protein RRF57_009124 [Xylaria bambusicola]|uniref:Uncharacterized protein n=1 Tax=Xylaria bambusicola TaxID=326684 RepID=A0AAN7ZBS9_9PEZI